MQQFSMSLIRASRQMGSLLHVAMLLHVEPRQVYLWIADLERPTDEQIGQFEERLLSINKQAA